MGFCGPRRPAGAARAGEPPTDLPAAWIDFVETHIARPRAEQAAAAAIETLTPIEDQTSQAVRDQYTALPYPRWLATRAIAAQPRRTILQGMLSANPPLSRPPDPRPLQVLVAGCGTGKHAVDVATRFADAKVLAVDLSRRSLGYAQAQAERLHDPRLAKDRLRFAEADILALGSLQDRFDHIEAMGVLHHLADPLDGWQVLCHLLKPDGTMRIGLYSRRGRAAIQAAQRIANDFARDAQGLRSLRQAILALPSDHPAAPVRKGLDFYTLNGARDTLAHAQEHDFTLPEIGALLERLGLRFLGFELATAEPRRLFEKAFGPDHRQNDLNAWDRLEQQHPSLFHHMYQFWCERLDRA